MGTNNNRKQNSLIDETKSLCAIGRGVILTNATWIENLLTSIIADCFEPTDKDNSSMGFEIPLTDKAIALKGIILKRMDFRDKIEVFTECVQVANPTVYKDNLPLIKCITKELNTLREFRNLLAHSPADWSWTQDNHIFTISQYKKELCKLSKSMKTDWNQKLTGGLRCGHSYFSYGILSISDLNTPKSMLN